MAITYIGGHHEYGIDHALIDSEEDVENLEMCEEGSEAIDIVNKELYIKREGKAWQKWGTSTVINGKG